MNPRRLVLKHLTGRYAGIDQIHGVETGTPLLDEEMPPQVEVQMLDGGTRLVELVRSTERTVFYREVLEAAA